MPCRAFVPLALLCLLAMPALGQQPQQTFGCEANPTGNPIGGGEGYQPIFTSGDFTVRTSDELVAAMQQAQPGQVVWLPGEVEIDLTGSEAIEIPAGVTLASARGLEGSLGARLFSTEYIRPMLTAAGDEVRITGLRIEGPAPEADTTDGSLGIQLDHYGCRVDNCEVSGFGYVGVGGSGCDLRIYHNYIHHCQRSGLGYGVSTGSSEAYIIGNRFDYTRHAIASSGAPGSGYEAAWNLVGPNETSHSFDMHGGVDRGDGTLIAGDWMLVHHNTFLGPARAVCIRGIPAQEARIYNNWFARDTAGVGGTIVYSWGNTLVYDNAHGPNKAPQPAPYSLTVDCYFLDADTYHTLSSDLTLDQ